MSEFRHPGHDGSMDLGFGPDPQPATRDNSEPATGGSVTLSSEQFEALLQRLAPPAPAFDYASALSEEQAPQQPTGLDLTQLPSPAADPDGFKRGLGEMLSVAREDLIQHSRQVVSAEAERSNLLDTAWATLQERYPDIAKHPNQVQFAYEREISELRQRGVDPIQVLAQSMDQAVERVAKRAEAEISHIRGVEPSELDNSRTDMLDGSHVRPAARQQTRGEQVSSFIDDLKKTQRELGIY